MNNRTYEDLGYGINRIDTGLFWPGSVSCYLVVQDGRAAIIDTGALTTLDIVLGALDHAGLKPGDVDYIMPTHVHLDHAGAAGGLMQKCQNAMLVVHPRGARHMIDPAKLKAGAQAVYGESQFHALFGDIIPIDEERVVIAEDSHKIDLNGRIFEIIDSPGHAKHHYCVWDQTSRGWFTGDTFGLSYREFDVDGKAYILPTTTPVQFDPEAWQLTLNRLMSFQPQRMYLTHFSMVEQVGRLTADLRFRLDEYVSIANRLADDDNRHEALKNTLMETALTQLQQHGCRLPEQRQRELLGPDMELNAQGLGVWLDKQNS